MRPICFQPIHTFYKLNSSHRSWQERAEIDVLNIEMFPTLIRYKYWLLANPNLPFRLLTAKRRWSWLGRLVMGCSCVLTWCQGRTFVMRFTSTATLRETENSPWTRHWMRKCLLSEWRKVRTEPKRSVCVCGGGCMCYFLRNIERKSVCLHQHVYLGHKLKLCHVLNRCSATQRILCLWHGRTARIKYAESGIQV